VTLVLWLSLFGAAFLAATVVPFYSEFAVAAALAAGAPSMMVVLVASAGNTGGAVVNWLLGLGIERFRSCRWFPVPERELARAQRWFQRYGVWSLLFAWLPIGGDALTVIAGVMRVPFLVFLVLTAIGKTARYALLVWGIDVFVR
jgi:membrane protein YqaA with SNARE-associated domain